MIKTTYTCDRCGHTQETSNQMWCVRIEINTAPAEFDPVIAHLTHIDTSRLSAASIGKLWCRECVEGFGHLPQSVPTTPPPPTKEESFENMLRAIVRDEIDNTQIGR